MKYWLMKSEPDVFSYDDLERCGNTGDIWDGVRNYQARNYMKEMKTGDQVLFYHSNARPPGVVGIAEVVEEAQADPTQFDPENRYYDPKSTREKPRWIVVRVKAVKPLPRLVSLHEMKDQPLLEELPLVHKGNRLSVMPVEERHAREIFRMSSTDDPAHS